MVIVLKDKMEKRISAVVFCIVMVLVVASVSAEDNDRLSCCPPSTYVIYDQCYYPNMNITVPVKFASKCSSIMRRSKFSIEADMLQVFITNDYMEKFNRDVACHGYVTNKNLTRFKPMAIMCLSKEEEDVIVKDEILGYCMAVSVLFLGITAIIYTILGELRDLFGKSVINFCASLAIGLGILSIQKLMAYSDMAMCAVRGFLTYFFLMAAFFWANSISIQVLRDTRRPLSVDYGWREFGWYMLYSWGSPTILTTIMAIVNYHPGDHDRPGIGLNHCWFWSTEQQWYYMYSVMTILLLINFAIFIYITTIVWRFSFKSTHVKALKFKLSMTFRLIVLMGLPWIFEMVSSIVGGGNVLIAIIDLFNSLQGILVFLVLVVRKRVMKVMHRRGLLDWCSGPVERWLAVGDDAEAYVVQHTDVPLHDSVRPNNGNNR